MPEILSEIPVIYFLTGVKPLCHLLPVWRSYTSGITGIVTFASSYMQDD